MLFGVGFFPAEPAATTVELARLADQVGYDSVWVGDSHLIWRGLYVPFGAFAGSTAKVVIRSSVTNPVTRHLTVTAGAMATLCELSRGRAILGIGSGDSALKNLGKKGVRLRDLEEAILVLRRLLQGEKLELDGYPVHLAAPVEHRIPIYLAAAAPKMQELAGRIADGVVVGFWPDMERGLSCVRQAERAANRKQGEVKIVLWTPCAVAEDSLEAMEAVKPQVARRLLSAASRGVLNKEELVAVERLRRSYDFRHHMGAEHSHLVPDELVDKFAVAGTPDQVREKIKRIAALGDVDEIAIIPWGKDREAVIRAFAEKVMRSVG